MTDAPIYLAPIDREFVPHKYLIFHHTQHCDSCGSHHSWSEVYGETRIRAKMGHGYITNRRPAQRRAQIQYNLPIEIRPQQSNVPFCHVCLRPAMLNHLPNPPPPVDVRSELINHWMVKKAAHTTPWLDNRGNVHEAPAEDPPTLKAAKKPTSKPKFTVNDL